MKSYESLMKENGSLKMENAALKGQLEAALERINELESELNKTCDCEDCPCDMLGDMGAELEFDGEILKAEIKDKVDCAVDAVKGAATKVATSKFTKSAVNGCQKLLQKVADGIDSLEKKD